MSSTMDVWSTKDKRTLPFNPAPPGAEEEVAITA